MTKQELIKAVTQTVHTMDPQRNVTAVMVEATLDALVDVTAAELLGGGEVTLPRLGKFKSKAVAARKGRNPRTGEILEIPAGKKLVFITCKELKEAMRSYSETARPLPRAARSPGGGAQGLTSSHEQETLSARQSGIEPGAQGIGNYHRHGIPQSSRF